MVSQSPHVVVICKLSTLDEVTLSALAVDVVVHGRIGLVHGQSETLLDTVAGVLPVSEDHVHVKGHVGQEDSHRVVTSIPPAEDENTRDDHVNKIEDKGEGGGEHDGLVPAVDGVAHGRVQVDNTVAEFIVSVE